MMLGAPGRMLGRYHLIAEIARGGMGIVYLALVHGPGGFSKLVVVKELKNELVEDPAFLAMFLDEARLAARLNHPNIVQTNEVGSDNERHFMALEYLDGRTFDRVRRRAKHIKSTTFTLPMQVRILCDVLAGLDYAHKLADFDGTPLKVVHRDISPSNVFITFDGHVKLLDFGIAKAADHQHETIAGALKGKVAYMAPEQARGVKVDSRADLFSVGVLLWEAIADRRLRAAGNGAAEIAAALDGSPIPRVSTRVPDVDPELDDIVARATALDRDERYMLAADFQNALETYLAKIGKNPAPRDIAAVLGDMFRDDRAKTTAIIEAHVTRARLGAAQAADLPVIEVTGGPVHVTPVGRDALLNFGTPTSHDGFTTGSLVPSDGVRNVENVHYTPAAPTKSRVPWLVAVGILAAAGAFGAFHFGTRTTPRSQPPVPAPTPALASIAAAPAAKPAEPPTAHEPSPPEVVVVDIRAKPAHAQITIDDAVVSGNPFTGKYREDGVMHRVRVTARGFEPVTRDVPFSGNVTLDIDLVRSVAEASAPGRPTAAVRRKPAPVRAEPAPPPAPVIVQPPPPPKPDPSQINPNGGQKPRRTIDSNNPYNQ